MAKFCSQCGATVAEGQRYCNKCGTNLLPTQPANPQAYAPPPPVSTPGVGLPNYQPPQYPQAPYQNPYGQPSTSSTPGLGLAPNILALLCYLLMPLSGILFLVLEPYSKDRTLRFHAWQGIFYALGWIGMTQIVMRILGVILPGFLSGLLWLIVSLGFFAGWIYLMIQACQSRVEKLPIIGDLAEQQAQQNISL